MPGFMYVPQKRTMWDQIFPMAMQMVFQKKMADDRLAAQKEIAQQNTQAELEKEKRQRKYKQEDRYQALREKGWETPEQMGYGDAYAPPPDTIRAGRGLYRPPVIPKIYPIGGTGGHMVVLGNKMQYIKPEVGVSPPIIIDKTNQQQYGLPIGSVIQTKGNEIIKKYVPKEERLQKPTRVYMTKVNPDGSLVKVQVPETNVRAWESKGFQRGQITKPAGGAVPEGYKESLVSAFDALDKGADQMEVFKRLRKAFPRQAKELKTLLIDSNKLPADVQLDIAESAKLISQGGDPNEIYRGIAAKYPKYARTIRTILLTPMTLNSMDLSSVFKR